MFDTRTNSGAAKKPGEFKSDEKVPFVCLCFRCLSAAFSFSGVSASASGSSYHEESFLHGADQVDHHTQECVYIGAKRTRTPKREKYTRFEIRF